MLYLKGALMIGIPYFGENHNSILKKIETTQITSVLKYDCMYNMIMTEAPKKTVVIIDNQWFTWLRDIQFNYRDGVCSLPYFTYELYDMDKTAKQQDDRGHLLVNDDNTKYLIRHNYQLNHLVLDFNDKIELTVYDLDTEEKYVIYTDAWFTGKFSLSELYAKYINSAYKEDDFLYNKHLGGYHAILQQFYGNTNKEKQYRNELGLNHYTGNIKTEDFRDVREYRKEQLFDNVIVEHIEQYEYRRLRFDCMLFCIIKSNAESNDDKFNERLANLKQDESILIYRPLRDVPALIFKSYWFGTGSYSNKYAIRRRV